MGHHEKAHDVTQKCHALRQRAKCVPRSIFSPQFGNMEVAGGYIIVAACTNHPPNGTRLGQQERVRKRSEQIFPQLWLSPPRKKRWSAQCGGNPPAPCPSNKSTRRVAKAHMACSAAARRGTMIFCNKQATYQRSPPLARASMLHCEASLCRTPGTSTTTEMEDRAQGQFEAPIRWGQRRCAQGSTTPDNPFHRCKESFRIAERRCYSCCCSLKRMVAEQMGYIKDGTHNFLVGRVSGSRVRRRHHHVKNRGTSGEKATHTSPL